MTSRILLLTTSLTFALFTGTARAEVKASAPGGFMTSTSCDVDLSAEEAYEKLVSEFSLWYDASHSYSGQADRLSLDLEKACMLERLPNGGFVRHMEIVYHQPGKMLRMTGGLGPLQGMGVAGALSFGFEESGGQTRVTLTYNVSGAEFLQLDKIADPVDGVLTSQLKSFHKHCSKK